LGDRLKPSFDLSEFLRSLAIGQHGVAFIMEPDGTLIASSGKEQIFWFAGEQFMIYLHGVSNAAVAAAIAEKLRLCLRKPITGRNDAVYQIDASIGFAIYPDDGLDVETLLRVSDHRMFDEKRSDRQDE
jgi:GGDEF domain-containing protein